MTGRVHLIALSFALVVGAGCGEAVETPDAGTTPDAGLARTLDLRCVSPAHGSMVTTTPGAELRVSVATGDPATVASVRLNGASVAPDALGLAEHDVLVRQGMNHVEVEVELVDGRRLERLCTFLASRTYFPADALLDDAVTLRLSSDAIDDGHNDESRFESVADVLRALSEGGAIEAQLTAQLDTPGDDDLKPRSCDQRDASDARRCVLESRADVA